MKKQLALLVILLPLYILAEKADLIIFSYDRPMQLWALLESIDMYVENIGEIAVIYRASDTHFNDAYQCVKDEFDNVVYYQQSDNPQKDFKPLTMRCLYDMPHEYILFAVDDIIVKDNIDIQVCTQALEDAQCYGFYFRLGLHLSYCYSMKVKQPVPKIGRVIQEKYFLWTFKDGQYDWNYPHSVDMTIFKRKDVIAQLERLSFHSPNTLEGMWASRAGHIMGRNGLCCLEAPIVNLPLNRVQNDAHNRHMSFMTSRELLDLFNAGMKIDIKPLHYIVNESAHMEYVPTFISRMKVEHDDV